MGKKYKISTEKIYGKKVRGKVTCLPVTSLPVKHAQWSDPLDPPQILLENLLYTTHLKLTLTINSRSCDDSCHLQLTVGAVMTFASYN